jgi:hypothetical protein
MFSVGYLIINFNVLLKLEGEIMKNICIAQHLMLQIRSNPMIPPLGKSELESSSRFLPCWGLALWFFILKMR